MKSILLSNVGHGPSPVLCLTYQPVIPAGIAGIQAPGLVSGGNSRGID